MSKTTPAKERVGIPTPKSVSPYQQLGNPPARHPDGRAVLESVSAELAQLIGLFRAINYGHNEDQQAIDITAMCQIGEGIAARRYDHLSEMIAAGGAE